MKKKKNQKKKKNRPVGGIVLCEPKEIVSILSLREYLNVFWQ